MPKPLLQVDLLARFSYNPETGEIRQRAHSNRAGRKIKERRAGHVGTGGYIRLYVDRSQYYAHQIIWCMQTGIWPDREIDHRDRNSGNNKWANLRLATKSQNKANSLVRNPLNARGIRLTKEGRFLARIKVNQKRFSLGTFETLDEAKSAYRSAAEIHFGEFAYQESA